RKGLIDGKRNRFLLPGVITPLFVAVLFRVVLPGMNNRSVLTLVVHDSASSAMIAELRKAPLIGVVDAASAGPIAGEGEKRNAIGGLAVPANFDADVTAGKQPELTVYINNKKSVFEQN